MARGSMYKMVLPEEMNSVEALDHWKRKFDNMSRSQRDALDNASVKSYGWTNMYRYIKMRNKLQKEGKLKAVPEELVKVNEAFENITSEEIGSNNEWKAKLFRTRQVESDGFVIMVDTESEKEFSDYTEENINRLKDKWQRFLSLSEDLRGRSNMSAQDIFGHDNYNLYSNIMTAFTNHIKEEPVDRTTITSDDKVMPYFTPEEMEEVPTYAEKTFIDTIGKDSIDEFMESYKFCRELKDRYTWCRTLEELYIERDMPKNKDKIGEINQTILKLGWNPEIRFSRKAGIKCSNRTALHYTITDVTESFNDEDNNNNLSSIEEAANKVGLKAVFIVLLKSGTMLANAISKVTHSKWGHSGISFDSSLNSIYTFAMQRDENGKANLSDNGFVVESLNTYMKLKTADEAEIKVYAMFCTNKELKAMKYGINYFKANKDKTKYDVLGLIRIFLGKVKNIENTHMVCSEFVYTILSLAKISLKNEKDSSIATPGDIDNLRKKLDFVYIYDGNPKNYKQSRTDKITNALTVSKEILNSEE